MRIFNKELGREVAEMSYDQTTQQLQVKELEPMVATMVFMALQSVSLMIDRTKHNDETNPSVYTIAPVNEGELILAESDLLNYNLVVVE